VATSEVEICNQALILAGSDRITALSDDNQRARLCNELYTNEKNNLLYRHPWNFAIERVQLAVSVTAPEFGFDNQFPLPNDCLRVLDVDTTEKYVIEGRSILTNEDTLEIKYISSDPSVAHFSQGFCETLSYRLASKLVYALSKNSALADSLWTKAVDAENYARSFDAQEGRGDETVEATTWFNSRF
jgi:hypothetical protein